MGPILDNKTWSNIDNKKRYSRRKKKTFIKVLKHRDKKS